MDSPFVFAYWNKDRGPNKWPSLACWTVCVLFCSGSLELRKRHWERFMVGTLKRLHPFLVDIQLTQIFISTGRRTYPVHLHVLKLQAKVVALDEVAPQENLREEGLSKSFWLKETGRKMNCYFHHQVNTKPHWGAILQSQWKEKFHWLKTSTAGIETHQLRTWGRSDTALFFFFYWGESKQSTPSVCVAHKTIWQLQMIHLMSFMANNVPTVSSKDSLSLDKRVNYKKK